MCPAIEDTDRHLVSLAQEGDFSAFEKLVTQYENRLYGLVMRILRQREEAEEVVQETFLSALRGLKSFRGEAKFYSWLVRIATNHALKVLRKHRGIHSVSMDQPANGSDVEALPRPNFIASWDLNPFQQAEQEELERILGEALDTLEEKYRLVFLLRDVEGLSTEDTAQALGISLSNAKVRLLRARLQLRETLTRFFGDESTQIIAGSHNH